MLPFLEFMPGDTKFKRIWNMFSILRAPDLKNKLMKPSHFLQWGTEYEMNKRMEYQRVTVVTERGNDTVMRKLFEEKEYGGTVVFKGVCIQCMCPMLFFS